jgi:type VI protein secretion system component VasF
MARRVSRRSHQQVLMQTWWVRALLAVAFILLAYGFASLAIDSGNLLEYLAAILLIWFGVKHGYRAVRFAFFA